MVSLSGASPQRPRNTTDAARVVRQQFGADYRIDLDLIFVNSDPGSWLGDTAGLAAILRMPWRDDLRISLEFLVVAVGDVDFTVQRL